MTQNTTTFALLKPDATTLDKINKILDKITNAGFRIVRQKFIANPTQAKVKKHLRDLKRKNLEAYHRNYEFLLKGPLLAMSLERTDGKEPIQTLRTLVGATDPQKAEKGTIRHLSKDSLAKAESEGRGLRNLIHASDSPETVDYESKIWLS